MRKKRRVYSSCEYTLRYLEFEQSFELAEPSRRNFRKLLENPRHEAGLKDNADSNTQYEFHFFSFQTLSVHYRIGKFRERSKKREAYY